MSRQRICLSAVAVLLFPVPAAFAQATPPPFAIRVQQGQNVLNIADGGSFTMPADAVGLATTATITVSYRGTTTADIQTIDLTGHTDFSISSLPELPLTLNPSQSFTIYTRFLPTSSNRVLGRVAFGYREGRTGGALTVNMAGVAPEFAFSYIPLPGGNATPLAPGGTIPFPVTPINTTASATFVVTNRGSGAGTVDAISASGAAFQLAGLPLTPATVEAGKELRFTIQFMPKQLEASQGAVQVGFIDRQPVFRLEGSGSGPVYAYELALVAGSTPLAPGQMINLPDALVGEKSSLTVRVRNTGNADGTVTTISVQGTGFQLTDVPFLPLTLTTGASASFTVNFNPTQPGRIAGRLRIGADSFEVSGNGLGSTLAYSFAISSATTTVQPSGTVVFTPVAVGRTTSVKFVISNTGTAPTVVNSISLAGTNLPFTLSGLPALPLTLAAGASAGFNIEFTPVAVGVAAASLKVDTSTFTLSASAGPPDPLPSYRFAAPSGPQEPMQQPAVGLTLDAPYPIALSGTLTLAFNSDVFSNDPAVQFATGGRTINFTIPANTRNAVFQQNLTQVRIQTGTVAGTITLTPSFATDGGINLTPATPATLSLTVPQLAPRLLSVALSAKTAGGITLLVTGYATGRSVTQMDFQFTAVTDETLGTTKLTLNAEGSFVAWYSSTPSQQYGSLFTATVPFTLQGDVKNVTSVADAVQSVSVTLANRLGTSNAVSVTLR
ncbi:MAG: choice-of-anchor D domain-containing protein [Acidobacteriota bacterium]